jgi:Tol biopolymer transport system component
MAHDRFDQDVVRWLESEGGVMAPNWLHDAAIATALHTRQRPGWLVAIRSTLGDRPGEASTRRRAVVRLAIVAALVVLAIAAIWAVGAWRTPTPTLIQNGQILIARVTTPPFAQYFTMDADGSAERLLFQAQDCGQCAFWSPDGRQIMFPEDSRGRLTTAIVRADGTAKIVLQPLPDSTVNLGPGGWSADGRLVALTGWDDTDATRRGIYVAKPDGSELRQVTHSAGGRLQDWATFSPDGQRLLFIAQDTVGPASGGIAGDLVIVNLDGTGQRQLNPPGTKVVATVRTGRPMDWSPDGKRIVFAAIAGDLDAGRGAVFIVDADGGEPRVLSDWGSWTTSVDWSQSSDLILSGDSSGGVESMWLISADSGARRVLWTSSARDQACCGTWSPDGALILFERGPGGRRDLWTMRPDGTVVERLTDAPADYVWYSWAPSPG